jgi:hypothetical protein
MRRRRTLQGGAGRLRAHQGQAAHGGFQKAAGSHGRLARRRRQLSAARRRKRRGRERARAVRRRRGRRDRPAASCVQVAVAGCWRAVWLSMRRAQLHGDGRRRPPARRCSRAPGGLLHGRAWRPRACTAAVLLRGVLRGQAPHARAEAQHGLGAAPRRAATRCPARSQARLASWRRPARHAHAIRRIAQQGRLQGKAWTLRRGAGERARHVRCAHGLSRRLSGTRGHGRGRGDAREGQALLRQPAGLQQQRGSCRERPTARRARAAVRGGASHSHACARGEAQAHKAHRDVRPAVPPYSPRLLPLDGHAREQHIRSG